MLRRIGHAPRWLCFCSLSCLSCGTQAGTASASPFELEVTSVTVCEPTGEASASTRTKAESSSGPSTLGVKIRLTGHFPSRVPANYFYASLVSRDGSRYLPTAEGCRPLLSGAPLLPGETREGYANFPLVAKKSAQKLAYSPNLGRTAGSDDLPPSATMLEVALP